KVIQLSPPPVKAELECGESCATGKVKLTWTFEQAAEQKTWAELEKSLCGKVRLSKWQKCVAAGTKEPDLAELTDTGHGWNALSAQTCTGEDCKDCYYRQKASVVSDNGKSVDSSVAQAAVQTVPAACASDLVVSRISDPKDPSKVDPKNV